MSIELALRSGLLKYLRKSDLKLNNRSITFIEAGTLDDVMSASPPQVAITDVEVLEETPITRETYEFRANVVFTFMVSSCKRSEETRSAIAELKTVVQDCLKKSKSIGTDEAYGVFSHTVVFSKRENGDYDSENGTAAASQYNAEISGFTEAPV